MRVLHNDAMSFLHESTVLSDRLRLNKPFPSTRDALLLKRLLSFLPLTLFFEQRSLDYIIPILMRGEIKVALPVPLFCWTNFFCPTCQCYSQIKATNEAWKLIFATGAFSSFEVRTYFSKRRLRFVVSYK